MAHHTRHSFKWSDRSYTLNEIEEQYGAKLPQIVLVAEGYSSANSPYTISSEDVFFIKSIAKQPRLVVEDEKKRLLSIPLDYSVKFNVVRKSKSGGISLGPSRKLREILHHNALNTIKQLMLEMNQSVSVLIGADGTKSAVLGVMTVQDIYYERYYIAHSFFNHAKMHPYQLEFPVYLPITVRLAVDLTIADDMKLADVLSRGMELVTLNPDSEEAFDICFNPEIMLFEARNDEGYEYVNPGGVLDWAAKVERELQTVECVYGASKTVDTRRRDSNPELLDLGITIPRPSQTLSIAEPNVATSDPFEKEVVERPESPPPPVPTRGLSYRRNKEVPLPTVPILKDKANPESDHVKKTGDHNEAPNEKFRRPPTINQDISPGHVTLGEGVGNKPPNEHVLHGSDQHKISPRQPSRKGPKTAPKPSPESISKRGMVQTILTMIQSKQNAYDMPNRLDLVNHGAPVEQSVTVTEAQWNAKELSQSDQAKENIQKSRSSSDSSEKAEVSRHHENPYQFDTKPLVNNKVKKPPEAEKNREHEYDYVVVQRNRACGDGENEAALSSVEALKMAPKSGDIFQWADVPDDISTLTVGDVNACLRLLNLKTEVENVDGTFLMELSEEELKDYFQLGGLDAKKLFKFTRGWRPKF